MIAQLPYAAMQTIFQTFQALNPTPMGELHHTNAYTLLVAVALSAQATDVGVNKATKGLFAVADTPARMLVLGEATLIEHIKTIGLFRNKAKNVIRLSQMLIDDYNGHVPSSRAALQRLPGVGRKTAAVVLGNAFGVPAIAADVHVTRIAHRLGWTTREHPRDAESALSSRFPPQHWVRLCHQLIRLGRDCCRRLKPRCERCPVARWCERKGL